MIPSYLGLSENDFKEKLDQLSGIYSACRLCPRRCGVDRNREQGYCRSGVRAGVASHHLHRGEEPFLSGQKGSGTVFFHRCTMACVFCQNYPVSQIHEFPEVSGEDLAEICLGLQKKGAHNINFVTGTHFLPAIVKAVFLGRSKGLRLPLVWNSGGFENPEIIRLMENIIDIYLPDMKYADDGLAAKFSDAAGYVESNRGAVKEMFDQTGLLKTEDGIAVRGVAVRHLVLPGHLENSRKVLDHIASGLSRETTVSLMSQFFPAWKAPGMPELSRTLTAEEYDVITDYALSLGLENTLIQDMDGTGGC